jgi:hypothetical protein
MFQVCSSNLSTVNIRKSNIAKFGLLVTVMTFCAMKAVIVDDLQVSLSSNFFCRHREAE